MPFDETASGDVDAVWRMSPSDTADHFDLTCEAQRFPIEHKHITVHRTDELPHDWRNRPDHPSRDAGVVVQMRQKLLAIGVRLAQETLAVHETLRNTAREP